MTPLVAIIVTELAKQIPSLAIDLIQLFSKSTATDADWDALRAKWQKPYEQKRAEAEARANN